MIEKRLAKFALVGAGAALLLVALRVGPGSRNGSARGAAPACEASGHACVAPALPAAVGSSAAPTGAPRLLEFTSDFCPSCAKMRPLLEEIARNCPAASGAVVVSDVEDPATQGLAVRYRVDLLPTFVRVDAEGNEVERLVGEQTRARLTVALNDVVGGACEPR